MDSRDIMEDVTDSGDIMEDVVDSGDIMVEDILVSWLVWNLEDTIAAGNIWDICLAVGNISL